MTLSVAMITLNASYMLQDVLKAVSKIATEIVIVDNGSSDTTETIARSFGAKFYYEEWKGYGMQRNSAIMKCSGEWILCIDADEVISSSLLRKIVALINTNQSHSVFAVKRKAYVFGKKVRFGGWGGDYVVRLFKRNSGTFSTHQVHESFVTSDKIYKLKENLKHYTYATPEQYLEKINRYTTEAAQEMYLQKRHKPFRGIFIDPAFMFFKMYILKLGILDGTTGLLLAASSAEYTLLKYYKLSRLYEKDK